MAARPGGGRQRGKKGQQRRQEHRTEQRSREQESTDKQRTLLSSNGWRTASSLAARLLNNSASGLSEVFHGRTARAAPKYEAHLDQRGR